MKTTIETLKAEARKANQVMEEAIRSDVATQDEIAEAATAAEAAYLAFVTASRTAEAAAAS